MLNETTLFCEPVDGVCRLCERKVPDGHFVSCRKKRTKRSRIEEPYSPPAHRLAGDWIEAGLKELGLTEEVFKSFKESVGLPGTCGCTDRKIFLNGLHQGILNWWHGRTNGENT